LLALKDLVRNHQGIKLEEIGIMAPVALEEESERLQPKPLQDKVALVTGGARGIGRAIALEFASRGATVAIHYRSSSAEAEALSAVIQGMGVRKLPDPGRCFFQR
jgi:shikimate 5-dehydrogenase